MAVDVENQRSSPLQHQRHRQERDAEPEAVGDHQRQTLRGGARRDGGAQDRAERDSDAWRPATRESHAEQKATSGATARRGCAHDPVFAIEEWDADQARDMRRHHDHDHARHCGHVCANRLHRQREQIEERDEDQRQACHERDARGRHR